MPKPKPISTTSGQAMTASIVRKLESLASRSNRYVHQVFEDWVIMMSCALSNGQREEEYLSIVGRYDKEVIHGLAGLFGEYIEAAEAFPFQDSLGPIHMELGSHFAKAANGEFYTPNEVCYAMAKITLGEIQVPIDRPLTVSEPACGAGATILAAARVFVDQGFSPSNMRATCVDVSYLAVNMCFIQLTLWGIPAVIIHGNSLSLETWRTLVNPFYYFAKGLASPAELKTLNLIRSTSESEPTQEPILMSEHPGVDPNLLVGLFADAA